MNLFQSTLSRDKLHKNYLGVLTKSRTKDRKKLLQWCEGFPDRDNKFVKEFQTTFNSSFWELYLYALFKELQFKMEWKHSSPDFHIITKSQEIIIEATIASNTSGKTPEWEADPSLPAASRFKEMNRESIIRLSNSISSKQKKYKDSYCHLEHVKNKPFVLAIAPFEQPNFNIQYDTPIIALLFDYYVDEDTYNDNPQLFPYGPPGISLKTVKKDNGSEIGLGIFNSDDFSDISAIIFSTTATWGKVEVMSEIKEGTRTISSVWFDSKKKDFIQKYLPSSQYTESIQDGLMIFHNPYAKIPLDPHTFDATGVVQIFTDKKTNVIDKQRNGNCLLHRRVINLSFKK